MCGIVGYAGQRPCRELLLDALERLEYRGYDSAGLSLQTDTGPRAHQDGREPGSACERRSRPTTSS